MSIGDHVARLLPMIMTSQNLEEMPMNKFRIKRLAAILIFSFLTGCNLFGPSEREVKEAMTSVFRAFEDSTSQYEPEVSNVYSNAADFTFRNEDESLIHEMSVLFDESSLSITGSCVLTDYEDSNAQYYISGALDYKVTIKKGRSRDVGSGSMSGELTFAGGKVQTIEFSFDIGSQGEMENFLISANGKNVEFNQDEKAYSLFRELTGRLPG